MVSLAEQVRAKRPPVTRTPVFNHQPSTLGQRNRPPRSKVKSMQRNLFRDAEKWLETEARKETKQPEQSL